MKRSCITDIYSLAIDRSNFLGIQIVKAISPDTKTKGISNECKRILGVSDQRRLQESGGSFDSSGPFSLAVVYGDESPVNQQLKILQNEKQIMKELAEIEKMDKQILDEVDDIEENAESILDEVDTVEETDNQIHTILEGIQLTINAISAKLDLDFTNIQPNTKSKKSKKAKQGGKDALFHRALLIDNKSASDDNMSDTGEAKEKDIAVMMEEVGATKGKVESIEVQVKSIDDRVESMEGKIDKIEKTMEEMKQMLSQLLMRGVADA